MRHLWVAGVVACAVPEGNGRPAAFVPVESRCLGAASLPPARPATAICCHPSREYWDPPLAAARPTLDACPKGAHPAQATVGFAFRVEEDGAVRRVCVTGETALSEETVGCMMMALLDVAYPPPTQSDLECGLRTVRYRWTSDP
jgi:hypothetical protein